MFRIVSVNDRYYCDGDYTRQVTLRASSKNFHKLLDWVDGSLTAARTHEFICIRGGYDEAFLSLFGVSDSDLMLIMLKADN